MSAATLPRRPPRLGSLGAHREPCPFCRFASPIYRTSSAKRLVALGRNKWIECPECGARGPGASGWKAANALWNLRRDETEERPAESTLDKLSARARERAVGMIGRRG